MTDDTPIAQPDETAEKAWPPWAKGYLEALARVPSPTRAAEAAGIAKSTAWRLTQRDEAFALACHDARDKALDRLEEVVYARATRGLPQVKTVTKTLADGTKETTITEELHTSDTLAMFYLKRWRPEFRESFVVENTGPGGGALKHEVTIVDEAVAEFRAKLERLGEDDAVPAG